MLDTAFIQNNMSKKNLTTESKIEIINSFSQIIQTKDSVDDTLWSIAKNTLYKKLLTEIKIQIQEKYSIQ